MGAGALRESGGAGEEKEEGFRDHLYHCWFVYDCWFQTATLERWFQTVSSENIVIVVMRGLTLLFQVVCIICRP